MITVSVLINGKAIFTRTAVNVTPGGASDDEVHTYKLDDGNVIKHRRNDGAVKLAKKMLSKIKEQL